MKYAAYVALFLIIFSLHSFLLYAIRWLLYRPSFSSFGFPFIESAKFQSADSSGLSSAFSLGVILGRYQSLTSDYLSYRPEDTWFGLFPYSVWLLTSLYSFFFVFMIQFRLPWLIFIILISVDITASVFLTSAIFKKRNKDLFVESRYTLEYLKSDYSFPPARSISYQEKLSAAHILPSNSFDDFSIYFMEQRILFYENTLPKLEKRRLLLPPLLTLMIISAFFLSYLLK